MTQPATRNITLTIGGRGHVVATTAEDEPHLRMLAAMIDERVRRQSAMPGQSEARMLLFAALVLADELHTLQAAPPVVNGVTPDTAPETLARLATLADRVEQIAARLERSEA